MRRPAWRKRSTQGHDPAVSASLVMSLDTELNRPHAVELAERVRAYLEGLPNARTIEIDLTRIPQWDIDGASVLAELAEKFEPRVRIVGLEAATERLIGHAAVRMPNAPMRIERLHNVAVLRTEPGDPIDDVQLELAMTTVATHVSTIVIDLRDSAPADADAVLALSFASSEAKLRGQELLIVNVDGITADALRHVGLSQRTYVSPEPLQD